MKKLLLTLICLFVSFEVKSQGIFRLPHKECVELIKKGKQITQNNSEIGSDVLYLYKDKLFSVNFHVFKIRCYEFTEDLDLKEGGPKFK